MTVTVNIEGDGSLLVERGSIKANSIILGGDLQADFGIEADSEICVTGSVAAGDYSYEYGVEAAGGIFVDGGLRVPSLP